MKTIRIRILFNRDKNIETGQTSFDALTNRVGAGRFFFLLLEGRTEGFTAFLFIALCHLAFYDVLREGF